MYFEATTSEEAAVWKLKSFKWSSFTGASTMQLSLSQALHTLIHGRQLSIWQGRILIFGKHIPHVLTMGRTYVVAYHIPYGHGIRHEYKLGNNEIILAPMYCNVNCSQMQFWKGILCCAVLDMFRYQLLGKKLLQNFENSLLLCCLDLIYCAKKLIEMKDVNCKEICSFIILVDWKWLKW